MQTRKRP